MILLRLLPALGAVILLGRLLSRPLARLRQPPVVGEILAGILLGPSLLGPRVSEMILPQATAPALQIVARVGVTLYMFVVGLRLDTRLLRRRARATVGISLASILVPWILGTAIAPWLYSRVSGPDTPFLPFALFLGVAMSITAFPVLARILDDSGMTNTEMGSVALSCAATDDVTAWCLLGLLVGTVRSQAGAGGIVVAGAVGFIAVLFLVVRPAARRLFTAGAGRLPRDLAVASGLLLLAAGASERVGIHSIFGAFLLGGVIPHDSAVARAIVRGLERPVAWLLLPAFFAFTGMRTRIDLLSGGGAWLTCAVIVLIAVAGKFGGTWGAARLAGFGGRQAAILGTLMNTRGLMELIVLNVGLDLGVVSPVLFAMMVLMALATTVAAGPVLGWIAPLPDRPVAAPERPGGE